MTKTSWRCAAALLCGVLWPTAILAGDPLWLSDVSPHAGHGGGQHAHGGPVIIRRGVYHKHLWLRLGDTPADAGYVQGASHLSPLLLLDTEGKLHEQPLDLDKEHGLYNTLFAMPKEGFYNAYVTHEWVADGVREMKIAKAEVLKHSCREGHDHVKPLMPVKSADVIPLEIVRERLPSENFHTLLGSGDTLTFQVLRQGQPLRGAQVTFTSYAGWKNQAVSDEQGRVRFTVIRDYYSAWHEFDKRHAQGYLVDASYSAPDTGNLDGAAYQRTVYRTSLAGNYYPSPRDYESYAFGLGIGLFALFATGIGIYVYRRRRHRPYREMRFDE